MAAKGNPSALHLVFAKEEYSTPSWEKIRLARNAFASLSHLTPFIKFAGDQMERLCGRKGQKYIHRAVLEEKHGYDTKYAMQVICLYLEAKEYIEKGRITLPNPKVDLLVAIREGNYARSEIEEMGRQLESEAQAAQATSPLPDCVDLNAITSLITSVYLDLCGVHKQA